MSFGVSGCHLHGACGRSLLHSYHDSRVEHGLEWVEQRPHYCCMWLCSGCKCERPVFLHYLLVLLRPVLVGCFTSVLGVIPVSCRSVLSPIDKRSPISPIRVVR